MERRWLTPYPFRGGTDSSVKKEKIIIINAFTHSTFFFFFFFFFLFLSIFYFIIACIIIIIFFSFTFTSVIRKWEKRPRDVVSVVCGSFVSCSGKNGKVLYCLKRAAHHAREVGDGLVHCGTTHYHAKYPV